MEKPKKNFEFNKIKDPGQTKKVFSKNKLVGDVRKKPFKLALNLNKERYKNLRILHQNPFEKLVFFGLKKTKKADRLRQALLRKPSYSSVMQIKRKSVLFSKFVKRVLFIKISPNNTLISLSTLSGKISHTISAGRLKLKSSKRTFRFVHKLVLERFFDFLRRKNLLSSIIIKILAPKNMRYRITKEFLKKHLRQKDKKKYFLMGISKLSFNGCRAPKQRRKKRKGLQIFKA